MNPIDLNLIHALQHDDPNADRGPGRPPGVSPKKYPMTPLKRAILIFMAVNGITREEAAQRLGISYGTMSSIFTNSRPSTRVLAKLVQGGVVIDPDVVKSLA